MSETFRRERRGLAGWLSRRTLVLVREPLLISRTTTFSKKPLTPPQRGLTRGTTLYTARANDRFGRGTVWVLL